MDAYAGGMGIGFAMVSRLTLLFSLAWIIGMAEPWYVLFDQAFSGRDLVLTVGGDEKIPSNYSGFFGTIVQVTLLYIVYSLDSVITAVGLVQHISVMV